MNHHEPQSRPPFWINNLLVIAALLACASAVVVALDGWEKGHHSHFRMISDITVNLNGRPVREHCTTCHPGGAAAIVGEKNTILPKHPTIKPHSVEKLGCTGCHLGEGMALDAKLSHGLPGAGGQEVLTGNNVQASCYTCHEVQPLKGAEKAWSGYELFFVNACGTCHHVAGLGEGGRYGPDLSTIGSYLGLEKIYEGIREPKKEPENSIMPRFSLSPKQARNISYFLKSRVMDPFYATPMAIQAGWVSLPSASPPHERKYLSPGGQLLQSKRCVGCHKFKEADGHVAPDLTFVGSMRSREYIRDFILHPAQLVPGAIMPIITLNFAEQENLLTFLSTEAAPLSHRSDPKELYMTLCQRCHAAAGDGFGLIQPNLANFPRSFANNADFFRRISDERILKSIAEGIPGTSMPAYGKLLNDSEQDSVTGLLFSAFIGEKRNEKIALASLPDKPSVPLPSRLAEPPYQGECVRCHGIAGTGTGPEYLDYLPRPRNLTNRLYFAAVPDNRIARAIADGIPGTDMPAFRKKLTAMQLWLLVKKVRHLSRSEHGSVSTHEPQGIAP